MFSSNTSQVSQDAVFIEDVMSTFLYTGNGSTQTINNGIDLAGEGGLVWLKKRGPGTGDHHLYDTARGATFQLASNATYQQLTRTTGLTAFNYDGFSIGSYSEVNGSTDPQVAWTFRKQPKFFDVVTYTGDGVAGRQIAHNLGSAPGAIIVKCTNVARDWAVWHRSLADGTYLKLNTTDSVITNTSFQVFGDASGQTSTYFTVGKTGSGVNGLTNANTAGDEYVAYLFAHNAGGFGLTGTDNVISCGSGSWSGGSDNVVNLGYEVQWLMYKRTDDVSNWMMWDTMRGMSLTASEFLRANLADAAVTYNSPYAIYPTATGFTVPAGMVSTGNYIYIAIRRGPMKVPTSGTSVFAPVARTGTGASATITAGFPVDSVITADRPATWSSKKAFIDRLRGSSQYLVTSFDATSAERSDSLAVTSFASNTEISVGADTNQGWINYNTGSYITYLFRRAPGFFDEVCYTGTGTSGRAIPHNLAAVPELIICKQRSSSSGTRNWIVYAQPLGSSKYLYLNDTAAAGTVSNVWGTQTTTTFGVENFAEENDSGQTFVAYLFASCPGVQSIQSFVGDGTTGRTINCGFTGGARFVCIKATSTTGSWWTFDSARGITTNADPVLQLNSTAAEITSADAIDPAASGFIVNQEATCSLNASGVSYLVWAIA